MKRFKVILLIVVLLIIGSIALFRLWVNINKNKEQIPVLMYHNILIDEVYEDKADTISLSTFEKQLKYLKANGYKTLTLDEFYCWKQGKCKIDDKSVLLTFDDGFYSFHYLAEPLLEKYDMHAVNFVIGNITPDQTKNYDPKKYGIIGKDLIWNHSSSVEYGSHSYGMHTLVENKQKVYTMSKKEIEDDVENMKKVGNFKYLSYPYNTDTDDFIEVLKENNYKLAFRGEAEKARKDVNNYQIPRIGVRNDFNHFKSIFETKKYNNRYGTGLLRKLFVTIERKLKIKLV